MNFILVGFIVSLIGGFPYCEISENDNWLKRFVFWLIGGTIVWSFVAYLFMPQLVGPFWGFPLTIMIWITLAANVMSSMAAAEYHKWNQTKVFGNACLVVAAASPRGNPTRVVWGAAGLVVCVLGGDIH